MKYRIQFSAPYNNSDANAILNEIETIKDKVFKPTEFTEVSIIRKCNKTSYEENELENSPTEYASVDFDATSTTHNDQPSGVSEFMVNVDISFSDVNDFYNCINYLESVKDQSLNASGVNYRKSCRNFECRHEESPLSKDGTYDYMDFNGSQLNYPLS